MASTRNSSDRRRPKRPSSDFGGDQRSQGSYFGGNGAPQGFVPTPGVTVTATVDPGPPPTWTAIATHDRTAKTCSIVTDGPSIWDIDCP